ncbi:hypothetical protein BABINDRAFT_162697 [Babjeviella inositovora NRRL Y-12698]|uniref:Globin domain-containing protein n=1 Tax=Babjeviella inositovora NRRL Y-12698 TaxID=984486 RepID=A0A1E3QLJ5_9ASCO|nr:uncharacterized protein BABINDRAFT_162697 [Babjeviella inositovora NRRL Y-12698]ODQ78488.1 hypothetical protein BABINDRAFT_162697 [Babjeviella inositovora NRRL Y-12698]
MNYAPPPPHSFLSSLKRRSLVLRSSVSIRNLRKMFTSKASLQESPFISTGPQKTLVYNEDLSSRPKNTTTPERSTDTQHDTLFAEAKTSMDSPASVDAPTHYSMDASIDTTFTDYTPIEEDDDNDDDNDVFSYVSEYSSTGKMFYNRSDYDLDPRQEISLQLYPRKMINLFDIRKETGSPTFVPFNNVIVPPPSRVTSPLTSTLIDDEGFNYNYVPSAPPPPPVASYASSPRRITNPRGIASPAPKSHNSFMLPPIPGQDLMGPPQTPPRRTFSAERVRKFLPSSPATSAIFRTRNTLSRSNSYIPALPIKVAAQKPYLRPSTPRNCPQQTSTTYLSGLYSPYIFGGTSSSDGSPTRLFSTPIRTVAAPPTVAQTQPPAPQKPKTHLKSKSAFGGELMVFEFFSTEDKETLVWSWNKNIHTSQEDYAMKMLIFGIKDESDEALDDSFLETSFDLQFTKFKSLKQCFAATEFWEHVYFEKIMKKFNRADMITALPPVAFQTQTPVPSWKRDQNLSVIEMHEFKGITAVFTKFMESLENLDGFVEAMGQIGRLHGRVFGADEEKFDILGALIIDSLKDLFGETKFTPELQQLWARVYNYIRGLMLQSVGLETFSM